MGDKAVAGTRVYSYGCRPADNKPLVEQQMSAGHRYYNTLVEIEQRRLARVREILPEMPRDVASGKRAKRPPQTPQQKADLATANAQAKSEALAARGASGCYWGTYSLVEDAFATAARMRGGIRFRRWDGSGTIGIQVHQHGDGGLSPDELAAGTDTYLRMDSGPRYPILSMRIGSVGREPIWATFSVNLDRPIPAGCRVRGVRVHRRRIGASEKWQAQFVLRGESLGRQIQTPTCDMAAVDIGWRRIDGDLRIAVVVDSTGTVLRELRLPERLLVRLRKVEDLASIRAKNFNEALAKCRGWAAQATLPDWFREATKTWHAWRGIGRLAALAIHWRSARFDGDSAGFEALEAWRKQDKHLWQWEAHQRENVLNSRRDMYRCFGKWIARHRKVVVEKMDLRDFAEIQRTEGGSRVQEDPQAQEARRWRQFAGASVLRLAIDDAVKRAGGEVLKVKSAWTTQHCSACDRKEPFDTAANLRHRCVQCLAEWDQDENAARNLLRAAQREGDPSSRSKGESTSESGGGTKKLGPRRNRKVNRSQTIGEVGAVPKEVA